MQAIRNGISMSLRIGIGYSPLRSFASSPITAPFHFPLLSSGSTVNSRMLLNPSTSGTPLLTSVRTIMRDYWPRPTESKRIRKAGWKKRMSTPGGRMIIMRRILKGRYILTH